MKKRPPLKVLAKELGLSQPDQPDACVRYSSHDDKADGEFCTSDLLSRHRGVPTLLCASNLLALEAHEGVFRLGLTIPKEKSVKACNASPILDIVAPSLIKVLIQKFEIGHLAAEILMKSIRGEPNWLTSTVLPVALIETNSTLVVA